MENTNLLLTLASKSIESVFDKSIVIDKKKLIQENPKLEEQSATFVTLTLNDKLRGCIGSLVAHRSLIDDIIHNAKAAAFADPRFDKLTFEEFKKVKIEISLLTAPIPLDYTDLLDLKEKLIPNKHGVILELDGKRATFLPQVWEQLPTFDEFMVHLCQKAGLNPSSLSGFPKIQIYEAIKIK